MRELTILVDGEILCGARDIPSGRRKIDTLVDQPLDAVFEPRRLRLGDYFAMMALRTIECGGIERG